MPGPWPIGARFGPRGLEIAGVAAEQLAGEYGTPLLVMDEQHLRSRCRAFARGFPRSLYAVKAFTARQLIRIAREEGMGLLVASGGELAACLRAGVDPASIAFHGNNKSGQELELAVRSGIGLVVADNLEEIRSIERIASAAGVRQPILVRVIPEVAAGTHRFIETGELDSKFGTPIPGGEALRAMEVASSSPGLRFRGLHAHVGSQVLRAEPHLAVVDVLLDLGAEARRALGMEIEVLDLGGGFGATYTDEAPLPLDELATRLVARVEEGAAARGLRVPEVVVEPGRAVVANAVVTLYRVGSVKRMSEAPTLVAVDGGMSDNIRPALYGARYTIALASPPRAGDAETVTVVGRHCESGDVVAKDVPLPSAVVQGDLLAVAATGAYSYSMSSNYNRVGRPAVVAVEDGRVRLWLRRETDDDLERLEVEL